jgi:hypothetical protein
MTLPTLAALIAGLALTAVFCGWRGARPFDPIKGPRMIPWTPLMLASATGALLLLVHLVTRLSPTG